MTSHSFTRRSIPPVARRREPGLNFTAFTSPSCASCRADRSGGGASAQTGSGGGGTHKDVQSGGGDADLRAQTGGGVHALRRAEGVGAAPPADGHIKDATSKTASLKSPHMTGGSAHRSGVYVPEDVGDGVQQAAWRRLGDLLAAGTTGTASRRHRHSPPPDEAPLSPGGPAQGSVRRRLPGAFASVLGQHLDVVVPSNTDTVRLRPLDHARAPGALTGRREAAPWRRRRAPSAAWPACA